MAALPLAVRQYLIRKYLSEVLEDLVNTDHLYDRLEVSEPDSDKETEAWDEAVRRVRKHLMG